MSICSKYKYVFISGDMNAQTADMENERKLRNMHKKQPKDY